MLGEEYWTNMNGKYHLLVYADDVNMLGENLQTVREKYTNPDKTKQGQWFRGKF